MNTGPNSVSNDDSPVTEALEGKFPDVVLNHVSAMIADLHTRVTQAVIKTETQYRENLDQVLQDARELLRQEVTHELREEFEARFESSLAAVQQQFKDELQRATEEFENELGGLRRQAQTVAAEIELKDAELEQMNREAEAMLEDPDAELSKMIRHNATRSELRAYIRGLRIQAGAKPE